MESPVLGTGKPIRLAYAGEVSGPDAGAGFAGPHTDLNARPAAAFAEPPAEPAAQRRRREVPPVACRAEGCEEKCLPAHSFQRRLRACARHATQPQCTVDGIPQRACQQCVKFHPVDAFRGTRRSCIQSLQERKVRTQQQQLEKSQAEEEQRRQQLQLHEKARAALGQQLQQQHDLLQQHQLQQQSQLFQHQVLQQGGGAAAAGGGPPPLLTAMDLRLDREPGAAGVAQGRSLVDSGESYAGHAATKVTSIAPGRSLMDSGESYAGHGVPPGPKLWDGPGRPQLSDLPPELYKTAVGFMNMQRTWGVELEHLRSQPQPASQLSSRDEKARREQIEHLRELLARERAAERAEAARGAVPEGLQAGVARHSGDGRLGPGLGIGREPAAAPPPAGLHASVVRQGPSELGGGLLGSGLGLGREAPGGARPQPAGLHAGVIRRGASDTGSGLLASGNGAVVLGQQDYGDLTSSMPHCEPVLTASGWAGEPAPYAPAHGWQQPPPAAAAPLLPEGPANARLMSALLDTNLLQEVVRCHPGASDVLKGMTVGRADVQETLSALRPLLEEALARKEAASAGVAP